MVWREGRVGPGCESASSSMVDLVLDAAISMGRRPMTFGQGPVRSTVRYQKLEKVTDVRYGPPPFSTIRITFWEHDPGIDQDV